MAYMPFGAGPRACIAERFGLMQTSIGLAVLLNAFSFSVSKSTPLELTYNPDNPRLLNVKGGIHLRVEKLDN